MMAFGHVAMVVVGIPTMWSCKARWKSSPISELSDYISGRSLTRPRRLGRPEWHTGLLSTSGRFGLKPRPGSVLRMKSDRFWTDTRIGTFPILDESS